MATNYPPLLREAHWPEDWRDLPLAEMTLAQVDQMFDELERMVQPSDWSAY